MTLKRLIGLIVLNIVALPGAGQWRLKRRTRAAAFIVPTLLVVVGLFAFIMRYVSQQIRDVGQAAHSLNLTKLSEKLSANLWVEHEITMKMFLFLLIACYILSIADLVWLYQSQDK